MTKAKAIVETIRLIADIIKERGPKGIPSGHLYAHLMGAMSLDTYTSIIDGLKDAGVVKESNHLLTWVAKPEEVVK